MTPTPLVHAARRLDGAHLRLVLDRPKGNVIDAALIADLQRVLTEEQTSTGLKLVTLEGAGPDFSFGASVEEHEAGLVERMLPAFHDLVRLLLDAPAPTAALVRGRCLGGGFELVLCCDLVFAADDAVLGVPEIRLGVFPPTAAAFLPIKVGAARAVETVVTGEARPVAYWREAGLVTGTAPAGSLNEVVDEWFVRHLVPKSAAALGLAARAARQPLRQAARTVLPELERIYLDELMQTHDAAEGLRAFLEKRSPRWRNR